LVDLNASKFFGWMIRFQNPPETILVSLELFFGNSVSYDCCHQHNNWKFLTASVAIYDKHVDPNTAFSEDILQR